MTSDQSAKAALVVGFTIQGLAIARALARRGICVYALVHKGDERRRLFRHPVYYTNNVRFLWSKRRLHGRSVIDALLEARREIAESRVVIYPGTDDTVWALAEGWDELSGSYELSWSACRSEIRKVIQKEHLPAYCDRVGVAYPKTLTIHSERDVSLCLGQLSLPVLLKPNRHVFGFKAHLCRTREEAAAFIGTHLCDGSIVVQEWIEGTDRDLYFYSCFAVEGQEKFGFTGRKVRSNPPAMGIATILETSDEPSVREAGRRLLGAMNLTGPVAMEFKRGEDGFRFIEANVGRTEFCVDLAIQAGFDLPYMEFRYALGLPLPEINRWQERVWFDTDKEPFGFLASCLRTASLKPYGKRPIFPYRPQEGIAVRSAAIVEIIRKVTFRIWARIRSILRGAWRRASFILPVFISSRSRG